mgnify:CR=1 FL=1
MATQDFGYRFFATGTRRVQRQLDGISSSAAASASAFGRANTGGRRLSTTLQNVATAGNRANKTLALLRSALVIAGAVGIARGFIQQADALQLIQNRIRIVTDGAKELNAVQSELFAISQRTRTSFEANANIFSRFARATGNLNLSFRELLELTEAVNQAAIISGATGQETRASLIQFSQGLASGELRGQELRSVLEQAPRLAEPIARATGKQAGELLSFARTASEEEIQEVLGAEKVFEAIREDFSRLEEEFGQVSITIGQSFTRLGNATQLFLGQFTQFTGLGQAVIGIVDGIRANLDKLFVSILAFSGITIFNIITGQLTQFSATALTASKIVAGPLLRSFLALSAPIIFISGLLGTIAVILKGTLIAAISAFAGAVVIGIGSALGVVELLRNSFSSLPGIVSSAFTFISNQFNALRESLSNFLGIDIFQSFEVFLTGVIAGFEGLVFAVEKNLDQLPKIAANIAVKLVNQFVNNLIELVSSVFTIGKAIGENVGLAIIEGVKLAVRASNNLGAVGDFLFGGFSSSSNNTKIDLDAGQFEIGLPFPNAGEQFAQDFKTGFADAFTRIEGAQGGLFNVVEESFKDTTSSIIEGGGQLKDFLVDVGETTGFNSVLDSIFGRFSDFTGFEPFDQAILDRQPDLPKIDPSKNQTADAAAEAAGANSDAARFARQFRKELERQRQAARDTIASLDPLVDAQNSYAETVRDTTVAVRDNIISQERANELNQRAARELLGVERPAEEYADKLKLIREFADEAGLSQEELAQATRETRIELLESQTSASAGFERFFLDLAEKSRDAATAVEDALTTAFRSAEDAFVEFTKTGKFEFTDLVNTITDQLIRLSLRETFGQLGGSTGGDGFFGQIFGGGGGNLFGLGDLGLGGGSTEEQLNGGITAAAGAGGSGGGGFFGDLFGGVSNLLPFANGGSFTVGPSTSVGSLQGRDNRLVAFRGDDGEEVNITPKGESGKSQPIVQNINISSPNPESFRQSEAQIAAQASRQLRASRS